MAEITLIRLTEDDRERFILDNQYAFKYGAMEEFGERDNHFEEDGEIISRKTIENSIDHGTSISMSTNAGSTLSSFSTAIIQILMIRRQVKRTIMKVRTLVSCSALKSA